MIAVATTRPLPRRVGGGLDPLPGDGVRPPTRTRASLSIALALLSTTRAETPAAKLAGDAHVRTVIADRVLDQATDAGWVTSRWVSDGAGPPRRFVALTVDGPAVIRRWIGTHEGVRC